MRECARESVRECARESVSAFPSVVGLLCQNSTRVGLRVLSKISTITADLATLNTVIDLHSTENKNYYYQQRSSKHRFTLQNVIFCAYCPFNYAQRYLDIILHQPCTDGYTFFSVSQEKVMDEIDEEARAAKLRAPKTGAN